MSPCALGIVSGTGHISVNRTYLVLLSLSVWSRRDSLDLKQYFLCYSCFFWTLGWLIMATAETYRSRGYQLFCWQERDKREDFRLRAKLNSMKQLYTLDLWNIGELLRKLDGQDVMVSKWKRWDYFGQVGIDLLKMNYIVDKEITKASC